MSCLRYHGKPSNKRSDDDSEDDEAELLRELDKIKRERAEEKARKVSWRMRSRQF